MNSKAAVGDMTKQEKLSRALSDARDRLENPMINYEERMKINELCGLLRRRLNAERSRQQKARKNEKAN